MPRHHAALTTGAVLALTLTACGTTTPAPALSSTGTSSTAAPTGPASSSGSPSSSASTPSVDGPKTASAFGPATWAIKPKIDTIALAKAHVYGNRVLLHIATETVAYDPQGQEAWRLTRDTQTPPIIVPMSPTAIGLVTTGSSDNTGLAQSKPQIHVQIVDLTDGSTVAERTVDAAENLAPELTNPGLGISNFGGPAQAITPDGAIHTLEDVDMAGAVGDTVLTSKDEVVGTDTWSSEALWDEPRYTDATVAAANTTDLLLIEGRFGVEKTNVLVDAATGTEYARPECGGGAFYKPMVSSPNGDWNVSYGAVISPDHKVTCIGGGEDEKAVDLIAVTDQGRAFGTTRQGPTLLMDAHPGAEPTTEELAPGTVLPSGVIDGDLAVHWDPSTGVLSANPIQD